MIVWIRLIFVIVASFFKPRFTDSTQFVENAFPLNFRVWLTEAEGSLLNNARYFTFTEVARMDLMLRSGIAKIVIKEKILPLVGSQMIRYIKPIKRFQKFQMTTRLCGWDSKWYYLEHRFERNGKLMAQAYVKVCGLKNGHTILPEEVLSKAGFSIPSPSLPAVIQKWQEADALLAT